MTKQYEDKVDEIISRCLNENEKEYAVETYFKQKSQQHKTRRELQIFTNLDHALSYAGDQHSKENMIDVRIYLKVEIKIEQV